MPRLVRRTSVVLGGSIGALLGAIVVFVFGVVWTNGTYGSRMAWLLAGVEPLLLVATAFAWIASPRKPRSTATDPLSQGSPETTARPSAARVLFAVSLALFALPFALALALLLVYAALFVAHSLSH